MRDPGDLPINRISSDSFVKNVENGKSDKVRITIYTVEGDPLFYNLDYNGKEIKYTFDKKMPSAVQEKESKARLVRILKRKLMIRELDIRLLNVRAINLKWVSHFIL